jgi:hypothetical protein
MHVLYFLLKKLMEPPFSEYLVLLKNRVTFSYSFISIKIEQILTNLFLRISFKLYFQLAYTFFILK